MPVYILREGQSNVFKVGLTGADDIDNRRGQLRSGNSQPLLLFDKIETASESACESFFHRLLAPRRVVRGGGWEFFEMESEAHMRETIENFRRMNSELENARLAISDFEEKRCEDVLLDPNSDDQDLLKRLMAIRREQESLKFERELIECKLKQRIGMASGIRGIATWKVVPRFDEEVFKGLAPEMYERLFESYHCLDATAWKRERPKDYDAVRETYRDEFPFFRKFLPQKGN